MHGFFAPQAPLCKNLLTFLNGSPLVELTEAQCKSNDIPRPEKKTPPAVYICHNEALKQQLLTWLRQHPLPWEEIRTWSLLQLSAVAVALAATEELPIDQLNTLLQIKRTEVDFGIELQVKAIVETDCQGQLVFSRVGSCWYSEVSQHILGPVFSGLNQQQETAVRSWQQSFTTANTGRFTSLDNLITSPLKDEDITRLNERQATESVTSELYCYMYGNNATHHWERSSQRRGGQSLSQTSLKYAYMQPSLFAEELLWHKHILLNYTCVPMPDEQAKRKEPGKLYIKVDAQGVRYTTASIQTVKRITAQELNWQGTMPKSLDELTFAQQYSLLEQVLGRGELGIPFGRYQLNIGPADIQRGFDPLDPYRPICGFVVDSSQISPAGATELHTSYVHHHAVTLRTVYRHDTFHLFRMLMVWSAAPWYYDVVTKLYDYFQTISKRQFPLSLELWSIFDGDPLLPRWFSRNSFGRDDYADSCWIEPALTGVFGKIVQEGGEVTSKDKTDFMIAVARILYPLSILNHLVQNRSHFSPIQGSSDNLNQPQKTTFFEALIWCFIGEKGVELGLEKQVRIPHSELSLDQLYDSVSKFTMPAQAFALAVLANNPEINEVDKDALLRNIKRAEANFQWQKSKATTENCTMLAYQISQNSRKAVLLHPDMPIKNLMTLLTIHDQASYVNLLKSEPLLGSNIVSTGKDWRPPAQYFSADLVIGSEEQQADITRLLTFYQKGKLEPDDWDSIKQLLNKNGYFSSLKKPLIEKFIIDLLCKTAQLGFGVQISFEIIGSTKFSVSSENSGYAILAVSALLVELIENMSGERDSEYIEWYLQDYVGFLCPPLTQFDTLIDNLKAQDNLHAHAIAARLEAEPYFRRLCPAPMRKNYCALQ